MQPTRDMIPLFLADTGYVEKPGGDPHADPGQIAFSAVPLLAWLYRNGQGGLVSEVAHDVNQNDAARLTCLLSLSVVGDDLHRDEVLAIYDADSRLECRVLALLMLGHCQPSKAEVAKLVSALDDDNQEIRVAAMTTLELIDPTAALPKLKKVMHDREPADLLRPGFLLLRRLRGEEPPAILVDYMQSELADRGDSERSELTEALIAFSETTGKQWIEAGAHPEDYYAKRATDAIAWWQASHR